MRTTTVQRVCAIYADTNGYFTASVALTSPQPHLAAGNWNKPPTWSSPAPFVAWATAVALGTFMDEPFRSDLDLKVNTPRDDDKVLRFALLVSPQGCAAFGLPAMPQVADPKNPPPHPWTDELAEYGWRVRTKRLSGPWLTIETDVAEIGICMVGWLDRNNRDKCAESGIVIDRDGGVDGFASCWVHGLYRHMTGWPLSAGAGMAAIKGLWRHSRSQKATWAPSNWNELPFLADRTQRPWHVFWSAYPTQSRHIPHPMQSKPLDPAAPLARWDANAAYLNAWTNVRVARTALRHTGTSVQPNPRNGAWPAGYYLISLLRWHQDVADYAVHLPPVWGARTPRDDGTVWVTHVTLDLIRSLKFARDYSAPGFDVLDSWTADDAGQLFRPWGEHLKDALISARRAARGLVDPDEANVLASVLKMSYARGYPLMERSGFIRRPDWVDAMIDQAWLSHYRRMWLTAWNPPHRFPLDVSADEIVYEYRPGDEIGGPLGIDDPDLFGGYKIKRDDEGGAPDTGTVAEWLQAHQDGRSGRWWLPVPGSASQAVSVPAARRPEVVPADEQGGDWFSRITE